jgi:D-glycero-alpha-D-manno-heptose-7-phosphate kinase
VEPLIFTAAAKQALGRRLLLFYTGTTRVSSDILEEQRAAMEQTREAHCGLVRLTHELRTHLRENRIEAMGEILAQGWRLKTRLASRITTPEIDGWYDRGIAAGAVGGKLVGAGGGGFLLFYCDEDKQAAVRAALSDLMFCPFSFEPQGSRIIYVAE